MPEPPVPLQVSEADLFAQIGRLVVENQALRTLLAQARQAIEGLQAELAATRPGDGPLQEGKV